MRTYTRRPWAAMLLLAAMVLPCSLNGLHAQTAAPAAAQRPTQQGSQGNDTFIDNQTASGQNLAKAEQEDEEYAFRHSASVRAIGRWFHLSPEAASSVFWVLNALILIGTVGYFIATGLPKVFRSRRQQLQHELVHARTATEQANERLLAVEERLARLDSEIAAVRAQAEQDSARDEVRIRESLEAERKKIVASSEAEIASAGKAAERRLRNFAAELAVNRATGRLHLSEEDDRALVREFAAELGANSLSTNGSNGGRN